MVGISDLIELRHMPVASTVRDRVQAAIKRQADRDAETLGVTADGGKVTLTGRVSGWGERMIAEQAAWACPGVTKVFDQIVIAA